MYKELFNVIITFIFQFNVYCLVCIFIHVISERTDTICILLYLLCSSFLYIMIQLLLYILLENLQICFVSYNCAFTPSTKVRHDSIQSQRRDANRANFSLMTRFDFHFCPSRASAFTWICSVTLLLKFKYLNFAAN